ncbi:hypothetical protein PUN28_002970 [Cardiocondyla obscurior]|uniref:Protein shisa-5-like n=1 Tax=Cardiocondyla obscurior TaxID=286306 RepID=A0AAW2GX08_9HYME
MSRLVVALLLIYLHAESIYGMECSFGEKNFMDKLIGSKCPGPFDSSEKSFCCYDAEMDRSYCCSSDEFAKTWMNIIIPVLAVSALVVGLIICCVCCLCCNCCPWYRRRQGAVYGKVQTPIVQVIQPPPSLPPSYSGQPPVQNDYLPYPIDSTGIPQPPPYNEAYAKQSPYNPAYPPPQ